MPIFALIFSLGDDQHSCLLLSIYIVFVEIHKLMLQIKLIYQLHKVYILKAFSCGSIPIPSIGLVCCPPFPPSFIPSIPVNPYSFFLPPIPSEPLFNPSRPFALMLTSTETMFGLIPYPAILGLSSSHYGAMATFALNSWAKSSFFSWLILSPLSFTFYQNFYPYLYGPLFLDLSQIEWVVDFFPTN